MARLSKAATKLHNQACELLKKDSLTLEEREFVLTHWREDANHNQSWAGAFFTPMGLAADFTLNITGKRIIDLCAGIGRLSFYHFCQSRWDTSANYEYVCIERNADYVEVGKKVFPEATWICADALDASVYEGLGRFDCAISNPPFGAFKSDIYEGHYTGKAMEYRVIEMASRIAKHGAFVLLQTAAPFTYSGIDGYEEKEPQEYLKFKKATDIELEIGCSVDTSQYYGDWTGTKVMTELVTTDFDEIKEPFRKVEQAGFDFLEAVA